MVKRFSKKQGSKQGVILLTVVFILAMAIIFIAACMVMTQATRNRLYWKAEQSQARLTVTSAAEAFYQALLVGDFKESALTKLAEQQATGIYITAQDSSGRYLPGMSLDSQNCTTLSLKRKDAQNSEIYAYLSTTIAGETEKVKITFKIKEKTSISGLFDNPVDFNGCPSDFNFDDFGYTNGKTVNDNFLVVRKGSNINSDDSYIWSNIVFVGGTVSDCRVKQPTNNDFIFLKDAKLGSFTTSWDLGTVYFVGTTGNNDALTSSVGLDQLNCDGVVFANRNYNCTFNNASGADKPPVYQINLSSTYGVTGTSKYSGGDFADLSGVSSKAAKYASTTFADSLATFPTTDEAFAQVKINGTSLSQTAPSTYKPLSLTGTDSFMSKYGNLSATSTKIVGDDNGDGVVENPFIKITAPGSIGNDTGSQDLGGGSKRCVFLLDGNTDYVIYLTGSGSYNFYQCMFAVVNPNPAYKQVFVLTNGADIVLGNQNGGYMGAFLSVKRDNYTDTASSYLTYLFNSANLPGEVTKATGAAGHKVSKYHDSVQKPTIYIMGAQDNQFLQHKETFIEAYLGLFNPDDSTTSGVGGYNSPMYFYGRMMFDTWSSWGDGGHFYMPYCPGIDGGGVKPDVELYEFGYTVLSVDYYFTS